MKLEHLVGERFKEQPADTQAASHALMIRGGYMKYVANGIYSSFLPLRRITRKIEQIIREEMDAIDGQEVQFPVVMPAALWQESGRYDAIGGELVRFTDRNRAPLVLGMTHEEAAVALVRDYANSYTKYPFMIYQIQTKFRDEARPRAGLIRVREFTMKDAYSFHTDRQDLETYYARCLDAYKNIYARVGIPEVVAVASDSGMMGGDISHEFMLLSEIGEDAIAVCTACDYRGNVEAAPNITVPLRDAESRSLELTHTPGMHTIEEVCAFLNEKTERSCKAVVYQKDTDDTYVILFLRGDLEANETKLTNYLGCDIHPADITEESGLCAGFIGPYGLEGVGTVLFDKSLEHANNLICGANLPDYHYTGLDMDRDTEVADYHDFSKAKAGGICPHCGKNALTIARGIEVGNIFQLGTKYTKAMHMTYIDKDGNSRYPVMGCYGIGIGRLAASIAEAHHDEYGPVWPMSVAPWQVHLCAIRSDNPEVRKFADAMYEKLKENGIEVIYDDRPVRAGVMFSDADLLGVPVRVLISPRNLEEGVVEIVTRDKKIREKPKAEEAMGRVLRLVREQMHPNVPVSETP